MSKHLLKMEPNGTIFISKGTILYHKTTDIYKKTNRKYFSIFYQYMEGSLLDKLYKCVLKKEMNCIILIDKVQGNKIHGNILETYNEICPSHLKVTDTAQDLAFKNVRGNYASYKYREQMDF